MDEEESSAPFIGTETSGMNFSPFSFRFVVFFTEVCTFSSIRVCPVDVLIVFEGDIDFEKNEAGNAEFVVDFREFWLDVEFFVGFEENGWKEDACLKEEDLEAEKREWDDCWELLVEFEVFRVEFCAEWTRSDEFQSISWMLKVVRTGTLKTLFN